MLYHLLHPYASRIALANLVSYISFRAAAATVTALIIAFLVGPGIIARLTEQKAHRYLFDAMAATPGLEPLHLLVIGDVWRWRRLPK